MKTVLPLIPLILVGGACCDAFVVVDIFIQIGPSKPAALLTILSAGPFSWENQGESTDNIRRSWNENHPQPGTSYRSSEPKKNNNRGEYRRPTPIEGRRQENHCPPVEPQAKEEASREVNTSTLREQQLELQIQELQIKLEREQTMSARQPPENPNTQVFLNLLDVSDNLARALEAVPAEEKESNAALKSLCEGVQITSQSLDNIFAMSGIVKYGDVGEPFDHNIHHALCEFQNSELEPDTLGHIIKAGYLLQNDNNSVLRYAEVAVIRNYEPGPSQECELTY